MQSHAARVLDLDRLRSRGASFAYPDALTVAEWRGLSALELAERQSRADEHDKQSPKVQGKADYEAKSLEYIRKRVKQQKE